MHLKKISATFIMFIVVACSASRMSLDFPVESISKENSIHVKGTKGKSLVGTKRKLIFDRLYYGQIKEGWTKTSDIVDKFPHGFFSKESFKRSLYENIGLEIDDVTSKTSDKFQFTISDSISSLVAFCAQLYEGKSTNYNILDKIEYSKGKSQKSDFKVMLVSSNDTFNSNWFLELKYERKTPNGIINTFINEGMAIETGQISNGIDTIIIKQIFVRGKKLENNKYADIIKITGGYEFVMNNKTIGMVDLYKQIISIMDQNNPQNLLITTAATALLLRNR